jgi:hypothetical protein
MTNLEMILIVWLLLLVIFIWGILYCFAEIRFDLDTVKHAYNRMRDRYERQIFRVTLLHKILGCRKVLPLLKGLDPKLDELIEKTIKEGEPA